MTRLRQLFVAASLCIMAVVAGSRVLQPDMWYDESGQLFISLGETHYSMPYTKPGGLMDILSANAHYNMDPGGFTLLLRPWADLFGCGHVALRLLPFLFYVGFCFFVWKTVRRVTNSSIAAWLGMTLTGVVGEFYSNAGNLRPYSMAMCFCAWAIYRLYSTDVTSRRAMFGTGMVLAGAVLTRYSVYPLVLFVWLALAVQCVKAKTMTNVLHMSAPCVPVVLFVFIFCLGYQFGGKAGTAYSDLFLKNNPALLLCRWSVPVLLSSGHLAYSLKQKKSDELTRLAWLCLFVNLFFIAASFAGVHPWCCFKTSSVYVTSFVYVACLSASAVRRFSHVLCTNAGISRNAISLCFCAMVLAINARTVVSVWKTDRLMTRQYRFPVSVGDYADGRLFVGHCVMPDVRYAFEYGALADSCAAYGYPKRMYFQRGVAHSVTDGDSEMRRLHYVDDMKAAGECDVFLFRLQDSYVIKDLHLQVVNPGVYKKQNRLL